MGESDDTKLNTWVERLDSQYPAQLNSGAHHILRTVCQRPATRQEQEDNYPDDTLDATATNRRVSDLLRMLRNDGYLAIDDTRYHFRSPLLRDFWINRYVR